MGKAVQLTEHTTFSGCGAKLGPGLLDQALCTLSQPDYPQLLADYRTSEDCGIYQIDTQHALVHTIDFFPPIVDDPFLFGRIAAANALSDIYAMGAAPLTAVSVVCFPKDTMDIEHLRSMTAGGLDALVEARTALVGGHSVEDTELKFGYSVTGIIDIDDIRYNNHLSVGDVLVLTKPIGTGIINTALRAGMATSRSIGAAETSMSELNRKAATVLKHYTVSACTDVTGFGLLGHMCEMINGSGCSIRLHTGDIPIFPDVMEYIETGLVPVGTYRNRDYRSRWVTNLDTVSGYMSDLLFDPQSSGGLLISMPQPEAVRYITEIPEAAIIAHVTSGSEVITVD
jgi:selenide,water dikinase